MGFPEDILADDEQVVIHLHPHWKTMLRPGLVFVLVAGLLATAGILIPGKEAWGRWLLIFLAAFGVLALVTWVLWPFLKWRCKHYVFTTHRVLLRDGVLSRTGRDIPLARVNDVSFEHNLLERMLGCGSLTIESAGENGQVRLQEIPSVEQVQSTLYQLIEDDQERRSGIEEHAANG